MANKQKTFNTKAYAITVFCVILAALIVITSLTFKAKYTGFYPEEVAKTYVDTIVQSGDGYNAYKNALPSVNYKYGDFIREYYMNPIINRNQAGEVSTDDDGLAPPYNYDAYIGEKTANDDGSLQGQVIDTMYPYYVELVANGWDDYDTIYTKYLEKLVEVRKEVFGDDYMTDEIMFTALEANVKTYGESLTGTEEVIDENSGVKLSEKSIGAYQKAFGEDYKITTTVKSSADLDLNEYKATLDAEALTTYGVTADDIVAAKTVTVEVSTGTVTISTDVTVVQINDFWYVDNMATDTEALYSFHLYSSQYGE